MIKNRRYLSFGALLVGCICIGLLVVALLPPPRTRSAVTEANFDRIQLGMSVAEVKAILDPDTALSSFNRDDEESHTWLNPDDGSVADLMFSDGKLDVKKWTPSRQTLTDKIRRWLHLP